MIIEQKSFAEAPGGIAPSAQGKATSITRIIATMRSFWRSLVEPTSPIITDKELSDLDERGGLW
jgi:hypothetical protein